ncbi:MAG: hypothetical protein JXB39_08685 [Deltaproteobacteria bacterium]|nr:hypothetical protein [Deltaproteobacteria bacterium]
MNPILPLLLAAAATARPAYDSVIRRVESMVWDPAANEMVRAEGLSLVNVTWEDTGRSKHSVWGPNISDMTIGVRDRSGALHPMPVIRFDNFEDRSADLDPDRFFLRIGNERGSRLQTASLTDILRDVRAYLHDPDSWSGRGSSLWAARDTHVLVSAQACFLPIPSWGEATFTPVLYNYQSYPGNPAVLTIVATREGTSIQVVQNEGGYLSEVLTFNENGRRAPFTAERLSDFEAHGGDATSDPDDPRERAGLNLVLVVQVPLKQRPERRWAAPVYDAYPMGSAAESAAPQAKAMGGRSDVEVAVVGHGRTEGPYDEIGGLGIERDTRYPIRVTVQFYKATSNGVVSRSDIREIRREIDRVYADGDFVGSLVTGGWTDRPTEWARPYPRYGEDDVPLGGWADGTWGWRKTW